MVITMALTTAQAKVVTYPAPAGLTASPYYEVTVNGKSVFVYPITVATIADETGKLRPDRHMIDIPAPAAMCYFDMTGPVKITVKVLDGAPQGPFQSVLVRPLRHAIRPVVKKNTLTFSLQDPAQLSVEPNGSVLAPLFIFANPPEKDRPKPNTPGLLYFGPGEHDLGVHEAKSNSKIYIAGGAVVYGQINGESVTNVQVTGRGILNGKRATQGRHQRWFKSQNITIDGIIQLDSPSWGIKLLHSSDVFIHNVKIINYRGACDAIDVCSSENVTVDGVFARTHDDTFNVKGLTDSHGHGYPADKDGNWLPDGNRRPSRNIRYLNSVIWNDRAHALMIGPETRATEISDVLFRDIDIIHALSVDVIGIFSSDSAPIRNIRYENIRIEDPRVMTLFEIRAHPSYTTADKQMGPVSDVLFKNITVTTPSPLFSALCGDNAKIKGVTFDNLRINGVPMRSAEEMKLLIRGDVEDVRFVVPEK